MIALISNYIEIQKLYEDIEDKIAKELNRKKNWDMTLSCSNKDNTNVNNRDVDENESNKVFRFIQSYVGVVNKMAYKVMNSFPSDD